MTRVSTPYGAFEVTSLPAQGQVGICHGFFVKQSERGKGLGKDLKKLQNEALQDLNYDLGICTVSENNIRQRKILKNLGWHFIESFYNTRLEEFTEIWSFHVPLEPINEQKEV